MSATYEPGTVAVATVRGVPDQRVMRRNDPEIVWLSVEHPGSTCHHCEEHVTDVRPLVVIDPEDREQVERLLTAYQSQYPLGRGDQWGTHADNMQAALRSLTRPPKPAEPTGLGAQVRDHDGEMWVRNVQGAWINLHGRYGLDPAQTWDGLCEKYGPIEVAA